MVVELENEIEEAEAVQITGSFGLWLSMSRIGTRIGSVVVSSSGLLDKRRDGNERDERTLADQR